MPPSSASPDALEDGLRAAPTGEIWIGDDAAVVVAPPGRLVLTTDAVVAGVHADLALVGPGRPGLEGLDRRRQRHRGHGRPARSTPWSRCACRPGPTWTPWPGGGRGRRPSGAARWSGATSRRPARSWWRWPSPGCSTGTGPPVTRARRLAGRLVCSSPARWAASAAGLRLLRARAAGRRCRRRGRRVPPTRRRRWSRPTAGPGPAWPRGRRPGRPGATRHDRRLRRAGASTSTAWPTPRGWGSGSTRCRWPPGRPRQEALGGGEDYELVFATADPDRLAERLRRGGTAASAAPSAAAPPTPASACWTGEPLAPRWAGEHRRWSDAGPAGLSRR